MSPKSVLLREAECRPLVDLLREWSIFKCDRISKRGIVRFFPSVSSLNNFVNNVLEDGPPLLEGEEKPEAELLQYRLTIYPSKSNTMGRKMVPQPIVRKKPQRISAPRKWKVEKTNTELRRQLDEHHLIEARKAFVEVLMRIDIGAIYPPKIRYIKRNCDAEGNLYPPRPAFMYKVGRPEFSKRTFQATTAEEEDEKTTKAFDAKEDLRAEANAAKSGKVTSSRRRERESDAIKHLKARLHQIVKKRKHDEKKKRKKLRMMAKSHTKGSDDLSQQH